MKIYHVALDGMRKMYWCVNTATTNVTFGSSIVRSENEQLYIFVMLYETVTVSPHHLFHYMVVLMRPEVS